MTSSRTLTMPAANGSRRFGLTVSQRAMGRYILALLLSIGLTGCGSDEAGDLRAYVADVKARQKSNIPPLPKPQVYGTFAYDDNSLRDPFVPSAVIPVAKSSNGLRPDLKREREVLEQYSLGSLKMVGSLEREGKRWALILTPDKSVQRVTAGGHMGQDNGEIIRVTETQVELREIVPDGLGGWVERLSTLSVTQ